ncbi:hypothetical protein B0H11DRAFT_1912220 [Mycena galericulata]|nr:hypothetical protein B0H11DRAFT_1912220 [Mycena galericulata]
MESASQQLLTRLAFRPSSPARSWYLLLRDELVIARVKLTFRIGKECLRTAFLTAPLIFTLPARVHELDGVGDRASVPRQPAFGELDEVLDRRYALLPVFFAFKTNSYSWAKCHLRLPLWMICRDIQVEFDLLSRQSRYRECQVNEVSNPKCVPSSSVLVHAHICAGQGRRIPQHHPSRCIPTLLQLSDPHRARNLPPTLPIPLHTRLVHPWVALPLGTATPTASTTSAQSLHFRPFNQNAAQGTTQRWRERITISLEVETAFQRHTSCPTQTKTMMENKTCL